MNECALYFAGSRSAETFHNFADVDYVHTALTVSNLSDVEIQSLSDAVNDCGLKPVEPQSV